MSVVFIHVEQFKETFGIKPPWTGREFFLARFSLNGYDAVTLFFVLSGFLITYLLLVEHQQHGSINVGAFYIRRALRIWPLYYAVMLMGFIGLPLLVRLTHFSGYIPGDGPLSLKFLAYLLLSPHILSFFGLSLTGITHLWTIGIEEHFYLIWPLITRRFIHRLPMMLISLILFKLAVIVIFDWTIVARPPIPLWLWQVMRYLVLFRVEEMAVGGLGAYILFTGQGRWLRLLFHPLVEKGILVLLLGNILFFTGQDNNLKSAALSVLYTAFILNVTANPRSTLKLENRFWNTLGRISYGIYMVHPLVIYLLLMAFSLTRFGADNSFGCNLVLYTLATALTLLIAYLSYTCFEQPFLRLKDRLAAPKSAEANLAAPVPNPR